MKWAYIEQGAHVPRKRRMVSCSICSGSGYIFRKPRRIVGLVTGIRGSKDRGEAGWMLPGDCTFSTKPNYHISGGDMITFTWGEPVPDGQVLLRGAGSINDNKVLNTGLEDNEDRLMYNAVDALYCEDEDGHVYHSNSDFILDTSKVIRWEGQQPQKGKVYTLKYNAYLEWIVFMPPDPRRDRDRDLGFRVGLRKRHVALANSNPSVAVNDRQPFCERLGGCT
jgi:hypothetical protein